MAYINIKTARTNELIDITAELTKMIPAGFQNGLCHLFCLHTTAGLTINENADPSVRSDLLAALDHLVPRESALYTHSEGNSAAHVKASLMGSALTVPVAEGDLALGTWQGIYFCEFDGPRSRRVLVCFLNDFHS